MKKQWPVAVTLLVALAYIGFRLVQVGGDPRDLAVIGTQFAEGDPEGTEGYDGQFTLYMALEPRPERVEDKLDVPAYRYQRALLPLTARALAAARPAAIPWMIVGLSLLSHLAGTMAVVSYLDRRKQWVGFGLLYGLWAGSLGGIPAMLHEPLAYGLSAVALVAYLQDQKRVAYPAAALALFAKETTLPFLGAFFLADLALGRWRARWWIYGLIGALFLGWQAWLWATFGQPGIGSGGAGATAFEWIPFMGFLRIAGHDWRVFALYLLLFGPGVILPVLWGLWRAGRRLVRSWGDALAWSLLGNALVIVFLPFSTFREPFGLVRIATGLILAVILLAADLGQRRAMSYGFFWLAYLAMIVEAGQ